MLHCTILFYREEGRAKYTAPISMWIASIRKNNTATLTDTAKLMLSPNTLALESNVFDLKLWNQWSGEYQAERKSVARKVFVAIALWQPCS